MGRERAVFAGRLGDELDVLPGVREVVLEGWNEEDLARAYGYVERRPTASDRRRPVGHLFQP